MPHLPDILVTGIHNHGGNNELLKRQIGSQSYQQIAKSFQKKKKKYFEPITIRSGNSCRARLIATATDNVLAGTSKACHPMIYVPNGLLYQQTSIRVRGIMDQLMS